MVVLVVTSSIAMPTFVGFGSKTCLRVAGPVGAADSVGFGTEAKIYL